MSYWDDLWACEQQMQKQKKKLQSCTDEEIFQKMRGSQMVQYPATLILRERGYTLAQIGEKMGDNLWIFRNL